MCATRSWEPRGGGGVDDAFVQQFGSGIGARSWVREDPATPDQHEDPGMRGAWGPNPRSTHRSSSSPITRARPSRWRAARRFTSSTCRLTRRSRLPARLQDGQDVRIGGMPAVIRDFLAAGLIDHLHVVVVPILLGRGPPLGRTGRHRGELPGRGHLLAQADHACDVHPCGRLNERVMGTSLRTRSLRTRSRTMTPEVPRGD